MSTLNRRVHVGALLLYACALGACSNSWQSAAINGRVIEKGSGAPVEGAIVLVNWQMKASMEGYPLGQLAIFETTTDAQGVYTVPAWGPREWTGRRANLSHTEPTLRVFKREYVPAVLRNTDFGKVTKDPKPRTLLKANADGSIVELERFRGPPEEYAKVLDLFWNSLFGPFVVAKCDWRLAPSLFRELSALKLQFVEKGVDSQLALTDQLCS